MRLLDRIWRIFGTAVSFALFGLGGLVMALTIFPLFNLIVRDRERRAEMAQQTVHSAWRIYVRFMAMTGAMSFELHGAEILRKERGVLVIANHPSLIDVVLIMSCMERTQCVVKAGVWRNPFMRGAVTAANYIPNFDDPERLLDDCVAALKAGNNLVIFPEGSRTKPGQKRKYQRGFARIALRANAPIRLVTVTCTPPYLFKGEPWWKQPSVRPHWVVRVHERIEPQDLDIDQLEPAIAVRQLCAHVERRIEETVPA